MKLTEIHTKYITDKGTEHNYLEFYENQFQDIRLEKNNILEIGVLHGGSLKLWSEYFPNSIIYGVENFSNPISVFTGHSLVNYGIPVKEEDVIADLSQYERISLNVFDSTNAEAIKENFESIKFNVIIDDASHALLNQLSNIENYFPYLADSGLYIIEDVVYSRPLIDFIRNKTGGTAECIDFNVNVRHDDRIVFYKSCKLNERT